MVNIHRLLSTSIHNYWEILLKSYRCSPPGEQCLSDTAAQEAKTAAIPFGRKKPLNTQCIFAERMFTGVARTPCQPKKSWEFRSSPLMPWKERLQLLYISAHSRCMILSDWEAVYLGRGISPLKNFFKKISLNSGFRNQVTEKLAYRFIFKVWMYIGKNLHS